MLSFSRLIAEVYAEAEQSAPDAFAQMLCLSVMKEFHASYVVLGTENKVFYSSPDLKIDTGKDFPSSFSELRHCIAAAIGSAEVISGDEGKPFIFRSNLASEGIFCSSSQNADGKQHCSFTGMFYGNNQKDTSGSRWLLVCCDKSDGLSDQASSLMQALWPHLNMAITLNLGKALNRIDPEMAARKMALVNWNGMIEVADPEFLTLLKAECIREPAGRIPSRVLEALASEGVYRGQAMTITARMEEDKLICRAESVSALDSLGSVEKEIARHLAEGMTYREIASKLGKSPNTVRNQIASIYRKLEVDCKVALITLFSDQSDRNMAFC